MISAASNKCWNEENGLNQTDRHNVVAQTENAIVFQNNFHEREQPTFGNISVTNGSGLHFGNNSYYQGPVTIQNYIYGDNGQIIVPTSNENKTELYEYGIDNPNICDDEGDTQKDQNKTQEEIEKVITKKGNDLLDHDGWKNSLICRYSTNIALVISISSLVILSLGIFLILKPKEHTFVLEKNNATHDEETHNTPIKGPIDPVVSLKPSKLKIVSRLEWLAQPPAAGVSTLKTPVPFVIISHTATENCSSQAQCVFQVRYIQTYHMESRGWSDIGYNFLVGGDGEVYYGRGWDKEGAHTFGYNFQSIGISFIGTFIKTKPPLYQLIACKKLIAQGVELGFIQKDYKLFGARQLHTTQSPGDALYQELQTWTHWANSP